MKKIVPIGIILLLLTSCVTYTPQFAPESKINLIQNHVVAITVSYVNPVRDFYNPDPYKMYIGAGVIIKGNRILTVAHLFDHGDLVAISAIRVWGWDVTQDDVIECKLVYMTTRGNEFEANDYAVIEMEKDLGLPGLKIADADLKMGEKAIFAGTVGGMCLTRFGFCTQYKYYLYKNSDGALALGHWDEQPFVTVYPGGNGDSGGAICNIKGEIVGIMYCGVENYAESYIFSNKLDKLQAFLREAEEATHDL